MAQAIHHEVSFTCTPQAFYDAFMISEKHAAFTGGEAEISLEPGGSYSCHGGRIVGVNIELVPGKRIVQAWRNAGWPEGLYTVVQLELSADGDKTKMVMDHHGVPDDFVEGVSSGWHARYWEPMQKFLS